MPLRSSEERSVCGFHGNGERGAAPVCLEVEVDGRLGPRARVPAADAAVDGHPRALAAVGSRQARSRRPCRPRRPPTTMGRKLPQKMDLRDRD